MFHHLSAIMAVFRSKHSRKPLEDTITSDDLARAQSDMNDLATAESTTKEDPSEKTSRQSDQKIAAVQLEEEQGAPLQDRD